MKNKPYAVARYAGNASGLCTSGEATSKYGNSTKPLNPLGLEYGRKFRLIPENVPLKLPSSFVSTRLAKTNLFTGAVQLRSMLLNVPLNLPVSFSSTRLATTLLFVLLEELIASTIDFLEKSLAVPFVSMRICFVVRFKSTDTLSSNVAVKFSSNSIEKFNLLGHGSLRLNLIPSTSTNPCSFALLLIAVTISFLEKSLAEPFVSIVI